MPATGRSLDAIQEPDELRSDFCETPREQMVTVRPPGQASLRELACQPARNGPDRLRDHYREGERGCMLDFQRV
jgi:hypothetical protein